MARGDPQIKLRVTEKLLKVIKLSAQKNNRSMNAEILLRLEDSFRGNFSGNAVLPAIVSSGEIKQESSIDAELKKIREEISVLNTELKSLLNEMPNKD